MSITIEPVSFKSASIVYSKVLSNLSSYDAAGLIDPGEFPTYIKHVLNMLGLGVFKEMEAIVAVRNYKAGLPDDFTRLYSAYKCSPWINRKDMVHQQGGPISVYNDVTWELLKGGDNCQISICEDSQPQILERITVRQFVREEAVNVEFRNFVPLQLSPNVRSEMIGDDCMNTGCSSPYEINIKDGILYTNFSKDSVYIKYYAFPKDENGVPMIPDIEQVEKAIEWCIKYEVLFNIWLNNSAPDVQNRAQAAKQEYDNWMAEAKYYLKLPSFQQMVHMTRRQRNVNKVILFAKK